MARIARLAAKVSISPVQGHRTAVDPDLQPGKNRCVALGEILHDTAFQALIVRFDEMTDWFEH